MTSSERPPAPLTGVRVVEFGQYIAIPGAAQVLADQGAEVIKVEAPGGEASRRLPGYGAAMFAAYNRGKQMVEVDLKTDRGRRTARELATSSDVLLANFKPSTLERLGLGADELTALAPRLVHLTFTGFGVGGPVADRAGLDIAAQAEAGIMWVTGRADDEPQRVGFPVVDAAATWAVAQLVTAALHGRRSTGRGARIQVSLWDVALHLQASNWLDYALTGVEPARKGNGQPGAAPAADVIRVSDGWIVLSAYTPRHWSALCAAIDRPELTDDPRFATSPDRLAHRRELHEVLDAALARSTRAATVEALSRAGIVCGSINSYAEAKAQRDAALDSPFRAVRVPPGRSEDPTVPPWQLGPLACWWEPVDDGPQDPPRAVGADNDLTASFAPTSDRSPS